MVADNEAVEMRVQRLVNGVAKLEHMRSDNIRLELGWIPYDRLW